MEYGALIFPKPDTVVDDVIHAERCGLTHAWIPDSHMIYGDTYACMALAAAATRKIKLGTGVAIAANRIPPVTVHSIATINQIAPGRAVLGFGTGHTGRRMMGLPPVKLAEFRREAATIRALLDGGEALYEAEGLKRKIRFLHRDIRFIDLDHKIPFYIAASAPKTMAMAGEFGDGIITTGFGLDVAALDFIFGQVRIGAEKSGRKFSRATFPCIALTQVCVLKPGEKPDSARVVDQVGHWVMAVFHAFAEGFGSPESLPPALRSVYTGYMEHVASMKTPQAERYLEVHDGHCTYLRPEERRFVTAEAVALTTLTGTKDELVKRIAQLERAGLTQLFLNPPMNGFKECLSEISQHLIQR